MRFGSGGPGGMVQRGDRCGVGMQVLGQCIGFAEDSLGLLSGEALVGGGFKFDQTLMGSVHLR